MLTTQRTRTRVNSTEDPNIRFRRATHATIRGVGFRGITRKTDPRLSRLLRQAWGTEAYSHPSPSGPVSL